MFKVDALRSHQSGGRGYATGLDSYSSSVVSSPSSSSSKSSSSMLSEYSCAFSCPELSGCIGAELYCDGVRHCPSGFDEKEENCEHVFAPLLYMYGVAVSTATIVICGIIVVVQKIRNR